METSLYFFQGLTNKLKWLIKDISTKDHWEETFIIVGLIVAKATTVRGTQLLFYILSICHG